MKQIFTLIFAVFIFTQSYTQVNNKTIEINNIETMVSGVNRLFWDGEKAHYRFPKDSSTNTLFAANIWMGGFANDTLRVAAGNYERLPSQWHYNSDFKSGFIGSTAAEMQKIWKITKTEIKTLRRDFDTNQQIDGSIPEDILTYPAFGNPNVVGANTSNPIDILVDYLPFEDRNNDGVYNIYDGDLPILDGDMQLFWLMNDDTLHYVSGSDEILYFDIIGSIYGNYCDGEDLINNTLFLKYDLINRSFSTIDSFQFGLWIDYQLGCYFDDFFGTSVSTNSIYIYNSNAFDGQNGCYQFFLNSEIPSFGTEIPIQSVTYLNQQLEGSSYHTNGGIATAWPNTPIEHYNYLTGRWRDGLPLTYGGNGYGGTIPYRYTFFENPADSGSLSMAQLGFTSTDDRVIPSTSLSSFQPNDRQTVEIAFITHPNVPHPKPDIVPIENRISQMQNLYDNDLMNWDVYLGTNKILQVGQSVNLTANIDNPNPTYSYLWSTGETTKTINVNTPNTYSVTVINNITGCTKTDQIEVQFSQEELEQLTDFEKIIVYPNPVNDVVYINFIALDLPFLNIQVYDMTGKLLKNISIENMDIQEIDVNDLNSGMYIFEFQNEVGETLGHQKMMILD